MIVQIRGSDRAAWVEHARVKDLMSPPLVNRVQGEVRVALALWHQTLRRTEVISERYRNNLLWGKTLGGAMLGTHPWWTTVAGLSQSRLMT
jgi:hypothetical protein